jgi:glycosyltransferase involved in cell wall biosynthesis
LDNYLEAPAKVSLLNDSVNIRLKKYCDQIINTFSKIPEYLNVKLVFLGDGCKRTSLEKLTTRLKRSHRIIFKGAVNDVNKQLINADFYLSASDSEGMSNSLLVELTKLLLITKMVLYLNLEMKKNYMKN